MAHWQLPADVALWVANMASTLHGRLGWRLVVLFTGLLFARGRRTVASWLRGAGITTDYKNHYYFLGSLGRNIKVVGSLLLSKVLKIVPLGERILLGIDDTPTERYGKHVEGAGIHHNPTPGPADQEFVYGHVWVTLALVVRHVLWGTIGLPLWGLPYVREKDMGPLRTLYKLAFRTKLELAVELLEQAVEGLKTGGGPLWAVTDGAYARRRFLAGARRLGVTVVSRLRRDAALLSLPKPKPAGRRGPQARYGKDGISLAKRAGQDRGWQTGTFMLYGQEVRKKYKQFPANYRPARGR